MFARIVSCFVYASALLAFAGCTSGGSGSSAPTEDPETADFRRQVLASWADDVVGSTYTQFAADTDALASATAAWAAAPDDTALLETARTAFHAAMDTWQQAEVWQVGPAGAMSSVAGGEDLRDAIYSWPLVNPCRVDQELVAESYTATAAVAEYAPNVRGLDALEYLLFVPDATNQCAPNSGLNRDGEWAALSETEIAARRATMAAAIAAQLDADAGTLNTAWGSFADELRNAGDGSETFASTQEALNAISDALFYLEKETKDMKLAEPVGIRECETTACPDALESGWAGRNERNILANLEGFERVVFGHEDGLGFDDLLARIGQESVAETIRQELTEARAAVEALGDDMESRLESDRDSVVAAHDAVKFVVDSLKTEFVSVLDLDIPQRAEGDND